MVDLFLPPNCIIGNIVLVHGLELFNEIVHFHTFLGSNFSLHFSIHESKLHL